MVIKCLLLDIYYCVILNIKISKSMINNLETIILIKELN
jgi:hypothetical protein